METSNNVQNILTSFSKQLMSAVSRESLLSCLANELKDRKGQFTLNRQFSQAKKKSIDPKVEVEQAMQLFNNTCEITQN